MVRRRPAGMTTMFKAPDIPYYLRESGDCDYLKS